MEVGGWWWWEVGGEGGGGGGMVELEGIKGVEGRWWRSRNGNSG